MFRRRLLAGIVAVYWMGLAVATHLPASSVPDVSHGRDKLAHFGGYAGLAFLLAAALTAAGRQWGLRLIATVWLTVAAYGALDELSQIPLATRSADPFDWIADACGAATGLALFAAARWIRERWRPDRL